MDQTSSLQDRAIKLIRYNSALSFKERTGLPTGVSGITGFACTQHQVMALACLSSKGSVHIFTNCVLRYLLSTS